MCRQHLQKKPFAYLLSSARITLGIALLYFQKHMICGKFYQCSNMTIHLMKQVKL